MMLLIVSLVTWVCIECVLIEYSHHEQLTYSKCLQCEVMSIFADHHVINIFEYKFIFSSSQLSCIICLAYSVLRLSTIRHCNTLFVIGFPVLCHAKCKIYCSLRTTYIGEMTYRKQRKQWTTINFILRQYFANVNVLLKWYNRLSFLLSSLRHSPLNVIDKLQSFYTCCFIALLVCLFWTYDLPFTTVQLMAILRAADKRDVLSKQILPWVTYVHEFRAMSTGINDNLSPWLAVYRIQRAEDVVKLISLPGTSIILDCWN